MQKIFPYMLIGLFLSVQSGAIWAQKPEKPGPPVNMEGSRSKFPALSPDGKTLVFASDRGGAWSYFRVTQNGQTWENLQEIPVTGDLFGTPAYLGKPSLNYNATRLFFSAYPEGNPGQSDIYVSEWKDGQWQAAQKLPGAINTSGYEGSPSISVDNRRLYFTRKADPNDNRDLRDISCKSLYFSDYENGQWQEAIRMPSPINFECDRYPSFLADNRFLIYSSIRPAPLDKAGNPTEKRYGGYDLYYTERIAQRIWSAPQILSFSTETYDAGFTTDATGSKIYFTRARGENLSHAAIYTIEKEMGQPFPKPVKEFHGRITDLSTGKGIAANIRAIRKTTTEVITTYSSRANGDYYFVLPAGEQYVLDYTYPDFSHKFIEEDLSDLSETVTEEQNVQLYNDVELLLNVYDSEIYEPLKGDIQILDKNTATPVEVERKTLSPGRILLTLPIGRAYEISASKKFFESNTTSLDLTGVIQFSEFERDLELKPIKREIEIDVSDQETEEGMEVEIVITNLDRNETIVTKATKGKDGKYKVNLREGDRYEVNVNSPKGYAFFNQKLDMNEDKKNQKLDVKLTPLKAETKLQLKNITFETNSAELNTSSFEELGRVIKLLNDNRNIRMEISAHTDDVGSNSYNRKLSDRRARSVVTYLSENGVNKDQMVSKGYGESSPLVPNNSEENRAKNRRVELEILEILEEEPEEEKPE